MARWPEVPDVYGWLSLTENGQWRLHPQGDALVAGEPGTEGQASSSSDSYPTADARRYGAGEAITSPPILHFIDRNYTHDVYGQWYFQNGPQKVYVRLDGAPYILQTSTNAGDVLGLRTHNGLEVSSIKSGWLDDTGRLYAMTDHGPGLVAGRDLPTVLSELKTTAGDRLLDVLDDATLGQDPRAVVHLATEGGAATLAVCRADEIPGRLGFVRYPRPLAENRADGMTTSRKR